MLRHTRRGATMTLFVRIFAALDKIQIPGGISQQLGCVSSREMSTRMRIMWSMLLPTLEPSSQKTRSIGTKKSILTSDRHVPSLHPPTRVRCPRPPFTLRGPPPRASREGSCSKTYKWQRDYSLSHLVRLNLIRSLAPPTCKQVLCHPQSRQQPLQNSVLW